MHVKLKFYYADFATKCAPIDTSKWFDSPKIPRFTVCVRDFQRRRNKLMQFGLKRPELTASVGNECAVSAGCCCCWWWWWCGQWIIQRAETRERLTLLLYPRRRQSYRAMTSARLTEQSAESRWRLIGRLAGWLADSRSVGHVLRVNRTLLQSAPVPLHH